jgi:HK97 family phage major capsid protein
MSSQLIKRAFDANAWTYVGNSYGQAVAPAMYDERVMEYQKKNLVVAPLGRPIDFRRPGSSWTVTVDVIPSVAALTAETAAAATSAITNRQVTFTPVEYTKKYEASYTELEDGFLPFMENATEKIGYALAEKKDAVTIAALYSGAVSTVYANAKTVATDIASTDTFNTAMLIKARKAIAAAYYRPYAVVIGLNQEADLLGIDNIFKANEFGSRDAIQNGLIANLYGFDIYVSDNIAASGNVESGVALGKTGMGEPAFAIATARDPRVEMDKDITYRQVIVVGSERYDVKVIHPSAVIKLSSYAA